MTESLGPPLVLDNNAGLQQFGPFLKLGVDEWQRVLDVNLTGTFHCCQVVLPIMIEAGWGRIVNISSSSTHGGQPYMAAYVSAKSGVVGLTKSLALEFGPKGITVNTIPPGFIDTPLLSRNLDEATLTVIRGMHPVGRLGTSEEVAALTAFLLSDEASFITGSYYLVDGGYVAQ